MDLHIEERRVLVAKAFAFKVIELYREEDTWVYNIGV